MTIKTDIDQLVADAAIVHNWATGSSSYSATMGAYTVRSPAKLIAEKDAAINLSADGVLALSTTQATNASTSATAAATSATNAATSATTASTQATNAATSATAAATSATSAASSASMDSRP